MTDLREIVIQGRSKGFNGKEAGRVNIQAAGAEFTGPVHLEETVLGSVSFTNARFTGQVHLRDTSYTGRVLLNGAQFDDYVFGDRASFLEHLDFSQARFMSGVQLNNVMVAEHANFLGVEFAGEAPYFNGAKFLGDVTCTGLRSENNVSMREAYFGGTIDFEGASIGKNLHLERARTAMHLTFGTLKKPLVVQGTLYMNGAFVFAVQGTVLANEVHLDGALMNHMRCTIVTNKLTLDGLSVGSSFRGNIIAREIEGKARQVPGLLGAALQRAGERYQTELKGLTQRYALLPPFEAKVA